MNQCQPFYFISLILSIPPKGCQEEISTPSKTDQQNVADRPNVVGKKNDTLSKNCQGDHANQWRSSKKWKLNIYTKLHEKCEVFGKKSNHAPVYSNLKKFKYLKYLKNIYPWQTQKDQISMA